MNYYETLYIVHPALETGRLKDTIENVQKQIEKNENNNTICTEFWGKKRLSYPIEKQKYGTYVLVQYSGDGQQISAFNVEMEHNPNILAQMTVRIKEDELRDQAEDIESQILGKEKEGRQSDSEMEDKVETSTEDLSSNGLNEESTESTETVDEETPPSELKIVEVPEHTEEEDGSNEEGSHVETEVSTENSPETEDSEA